MRTKLGIVVGRFQLPSLHEGHKFVINHVKKSNDKIAIFIGQASIGLSYNNPLPIDAIKDTLLSSNHFLSPENIHVIQDCKSDEVWSANIDKKINALYPEELFDVCLYGSRDSFIKYYHGNYRCEEIEPVESHIAAKTIRNGLGKHIKDDYRFREGIVYTSQNLFPTSFQCVDIAIIKGDMLLMGKKPNEDKWRFPGGFVDPSDRSLEGAAFRELKEECGHLKCGELQYLSSFRVDDWRYRNEKSKIMTTLFFAEHQSGEPEAGDDLSEVAWLKIDELSLSNIEDCHIPLLETVIEHYKLINFIL